VLLSLHDGSEPTLEAAEAAHAAAGVLVCVSGDTCREPHGQAALLTAVVTGVRAFGAVHVLLGDPTAQLAGGPAHGLTVADFIEAEGACLVPPEDLTTSDSWPAVLIGSGVAPPVTDRPRPVLWVSWSGWTARASATEQDQLTPVGGCMLAPIAAAAIGVSEAFGVMHSKPASDAGFRTVELNLWNPSGSGDRCEPTLAYAPRAWWLVGLGHLGQAYAWVISWLAYDDPSAVEIVLQDTDRTVRGNYSTGLFTPKNSSGVPKVKLVAEAMENIGFDVRRVERRLGGDLRVADDEAHVALLGVDNLPTRRLTSGVGWRFAVDVGLGSRASDFTSMYLRRFPGSRLSHDVPSWQDEPSKAPMVPATPAFADLARRGDECGVVQIAGKAIGVPFVGVAAACLAIAETCRELHGGAGHDSLTYDLNTTGLRSASALDPADVISASLRTPR
jgi:hypothetical protein